MQLAMRVAPGPTTRASGLRQRTLGKQLIRNANQAQKGFGPLATGRPRGSEQLALEAPSGGGSEQSSGSWQTQTWWGWHGWQDCTWWSRE